MPVERGPDGRFVPGGGPGAADTKKEKLALLEKRKLRAELRIERYERELNVLRVELDQQRQERRRAAVMKRITVVEETLRVLRDHVEELVKEMSTLGGK